MTTHLLIIDPQMDFCSPDGALSVPGAFDDMNRLADFIERHSDDIDHVTVTLDSHHFLDIGHPSWWRTPDGTEPAPFTIITADDVLQGRIEPADRQKRDASIAYLSSLEAQGRFSHTVWPHHCLIGTPGHAVHPGLMNALNLWSGHSGRQVDFVLKGLNPVTEHYSAIRAEVPDPTDSATFTNPHLVRDLALADTLVVSGEALSHCVRATVEDLLEEAMNLTGRNITANIRFLTDTMSPVPAIPNGPDFPAIGRAFLDDMAARGATLATTAD